MPVAILSRRSILNSRFEITKVCDRSGDICWKVSDTDHLDRLDFPSVIAQEKTLLGVFIRVRSVLNKERY